MNSSRQALLLLLVPCALISATVAAAAYHRGLAKGVAAGASSSEGGGRGLADDLPCGVIDDAVEGADEMAAVESVLSVWFDGSTADNHRTKWFAQVRARVRVVSFFHTI